MNVARDSPVAGRDLPLVVLSHGNGGGLQGHADLAPALANAGHVAAAPMHAGDNFADQSAAGAASSYSDRTRQLRATVDYMLAQWPRRDHIDPDRVGALGFSAGGFTVPAAAGAHPDMRLIAKHCVQAQELVCDVLRHTKFRLLSPDSASSEPMQTTPRLRAAVLAAPGLAFTMTPTGLASTKTPAQLWSGEKAERVRCATHAKPIQEALGSKVEFQSVPGAGHASFLAPRGLVRPAAACSDPDGFDR